MSFTSLMKVWLVILPVMIANGIIRELVLRDAVGPDVADALSALLGIVIIVALTRLLLRRLAGRSRSELVRASVTLVGATVLFEFGFGHYVEGKTWAQLVENYALWRGHLWPLVLATLAFMPFLWGRWSLKETSHAR